MLLVGASAVAMAVAAASGIERLCSLNVRSQCEVHGKRSRNIDVDEAPTARQAHTITALHATAPMSAARSAGYGRLAGTSQASGLVSAHSYTDNMLRARAQCSRDGMTHKNTWATSHGVACSI